MPEATLPDRRVLGWREYGDPSGRPVVCNHGGLVSGQDVSPADSAAKALNLRLISPDRPGIGASTPQPGRTTADWAGDVAHLADELGLDRFGAFGWSLGGQYALAIGARLAHMASAVVVVAGCIPDLHPAALNPTDRLFMRLSLRPVPVAATAFAAIRTVARLAPGIVDDVTQRSLCPSDQAAVRALPAGAMADWMATAMSQPSGMVEEYRVLGRPWGFAPADVRVPTTYWQGARDTLVPLSWAEQLTSSTPGSTLRTVPNDGHFLAYARWHEVLGAFCAD